jgi:hypothetical protein
MKASKILKGKANHLLFLPKNGIFCTKDKVVFYKVFALKAKRRASSLPMNPCGF